MTLVRATERRTCTAPSRSVRQPVAWAALQARRDDIARYIEAGEEARQQLGSLDELAGRAAGT
jgi:hypothetical protein